MSYTYYGIQKFMVSKDLRIHYAQIYTNLQHSLKTGNFSVEIFNNILNLNSLKIIKKHLLCV